ncbi:hypothetical protein [Alloacidobacterium sp.]|uniref:hypothetical protein n=1 Tax=Alloacidobacterium sp. TaxID=2951999 RepID=UPI002D494F20|nr:hypothetical protein [Alloacidobacterium sp.]HYK35506.1 hypothetical protein [Alloacidobacterium sp.]
MGTRGHDLARFQFDGRYGVQASGLNPSIHSYRYTDLTSDKLPDSPSKVAGLLDSSVVVQPSNQSQPDTSVHWRAAVSESLLYTGIMHTFNIWTEPGTRDALLGPWLKNYLDSVSELRGWSDSDRFMAPYVGHTLEGSIFGYIERQNDPRYRKVQWGDGREYYMSLLHSLAYSAVWHTQWKIGPASEASIGNVMLHASPGFITLTDTPVLGTVEMIGEDAADRYLIMGLENRTTNGYLIALTRTFLNPGRSFANVMAFKLPWHRENRIGLNVDEHRIRKELIAEYKAGGEKPFEYIRPAVPEIEREYPKEADIELTAFPVYETFLGGGNCVGGGGSGASRLNPNFQLVAEVNGCLIMHMPAANQSGDSLFYGAGLRWTPLAAHHISPYMQVMFGGRKVTHETDDIPLRTQLLAEWNDGNGTLPHYPKRSDWSVEVSNNGPALGMGGGFDIVLTRAFAWRLLDVERYHTWMGDVAMIQPQNSLRITTGAVLRIGTW